jgi:hypothetical protein
MHRSELAKPLHNLGKTCTSTVHLLVPSTAQPSVYGLTWMSGLSRSLSLPLKTRFVLIEAIGGVWGWECLDATMRFRVIIQRQLVLDRKCQAA